LRIPYAQRIMQFEAHVCAGRALRVQRLDFVECGGQKCGCPFGERRARFQQRLHGIIKVAADELVRCCDVCAQKVSLVLVLGLLAG